MLDFGFNRGWSQCGLHDDVQLSELRRSTVNSTIAWMSKAAKLVERMRVNPRDWRMESLEVVAKRYQIQVRKTGGSHFVFLHPQSDLAVTVPFRRPIKPIYITQFLALLDDVGENK